MRAGGPDSLPTETTYWQRRRGRVRVYFCCCPIPLLLLLTLPAFLVYLIRQGLRHRRRR
ncbi:MAG: hypothetical protein M3Q65_11970 [Chloroflexota bacterium]|nr:hypothetical protein [Chloroflexota bacterium]